MNDLSGKKIILGVSGSIAVYKSVFLCRLLIKSGAEVKVVMTPSAAKFVTPLSFSTISRNKVHLELIDNEEWSNHVELGLWGDVLLIAPATAQTMASCSSGLCNNMLQAVYLSAKCPVVFAPAMDRDMWLHPSTQENIQKLKSYGNTVLNVGEGELASGLVGPGRMSEPEEILTEMVAFLNPNKPLNKLRVLINAGPTHEPIDPVRFIGNRSTGKMGVAIARAFKKRGAEVRLILGPSALNVDDLQVERVESAQEMFERCSVHFEWSHITVLSAAVADFTPEVVSGQKIKKKVDQQHLELRLKKTTDIARSLGEQKQKHQILVGFALETENEKENALKKLKKKNLDVIVLNSLRKEGAGFGHDTNQVSIIADGGIEQIGDLKSKSEVAEDIIDFVVENFEDRINATD